jgi:hypothetical protein
VGDGTEGGTGAVEDAVEGTADDLETRCLLGAMSVCVCKYQRVLMVTTRHLFAVRGVTTYVTTYVNVLPRLTTTFDP